MNITVMARLIVTFAIGSTLSVDPGRSIIEESESRSESKSEHYVGVLEVFADGNKIVKKEWTFDRLGMNGKSKSKVVFTGPAEVKGIALLIYNHTDRSSDQWMWTPSIERDRRIADQDRSTRFFGTDFSFEDLEERDVNQFDYVSLKDEVIDGMSCWQIQATPKKTKTSQYTKSVIWIRKDNYATAKVESYDNAKVKRRLTNTKIQKVQGIWTPHVMTMYDLSRQSTTRLTLTKVEYNLTTIKEADFERTAISR